MGNDAKYTMWREREETNCHWFKYVHLCCGSCCQTKICCKLFPTHIPQDSWSEGGCHVMAKARLAWCGHDVSALKCSPACCVPELLICTCKAVICTNGVVRCPSAVCPGPPTVCLWVEMLSLYVGTCVFQVYILLFPSCLHEEWHLPLTDIFI